MVEIEEREFEKKIIISGQKFTCDDLDKSIPKPLPQKGGFAMLVIGKPGMGKTSLILSFVGSYLMLSSFANCNTESSLVNKTGSSSFFSSTSFTTSTEESQDVVSKILLINKYLKNFVNPSISFIYFFC